MSRRKPLSRRPRAACPGCGRSTAVTFDAREGTAFLRSHVTEPGKKCPKSGAVVPRSAVHDA